MEWYTTLMELFFFIAGIGLLYKCSDILVEGTSKVALRIGISSLIISLTIVAYGTSAPEFATSALASYRAHSSLSLGNVLGSCLANLLLVLGISAVIKPLSVNLGIVKRELPILLASTVLLLMLSIRGNLDALSGLVMLCAFAIYLVFFMEMAKKERKRRIKFIENNRNGMPKYVLFIIFGLIGVVVGAQLLVDSAVYLANILGVPEFLIAISMIAVGTSLPELAVSATASLKGESDISIGNLIGSNVFNILLILGVCSSISIIHIDLKSMLSELFLLFVTLIMFPIFYTKGKVSRAEGALLLAIYAVYLVLLFCK